MAVYFIEAPDGDIKIGYSGHPAWRARQLARNGLVPRLLAVIPSDHRHDRFPESQLHDRFRRVSLGGEWFAPSDELLLAAAVAYAREGGDSGVHDVLRTRRVPRVHTCATRKQAEWGDSIWRREVAVAKRSALLVKRARLRAERLAQRAADAAAYRTSKRAA